MTYIVLENCICCRYTVCSEVCPVNCFHLGANFLVINPENCIDCALCENTCPIQAIRSEYDVTINDMKFKAINKYYSKIWPTVNNKLEKLPFSNIWENIKNKVKYIQTTTLLEVDSNHQPNG